MYKFIIIVTLIGVALSSPVKIDRTLANTLQEKNVANILISFTGGNTHVINQIEAKPFSTRTQRLTLLKAALESQASKSQQNVVAFLKSKNVEHKSFWISNQIFLRGADTALVNELIAFPDVELVSEEPIISLNTEVVKSSPRKADPTPLAEWGVERIQAPEAWLIGNGTGVVVATISSGADFTHEALASNYRRNYGWYDPILHTPGPYDLSGSGTHALGVMVGNNGIGVAPGAQWVTCLGCYFDGCHISSIMDCGEWVLCPTRATGLSPDCSQAPDIVTITWGGLASSVYEPVTEAWIAGGIIPVFGIGNEGSSCETVDSPGSIRRVIGVGSTNDQDQLSSWSSVGPAEDGRIKPELTAPGDGVRSCTVGEDGYELRYGTPIAAQHVAGVAALMLSVNPNMTYIDLRQALLEGADTDSLLSSNGTCGGIPDTTFPNHHFGFGRVNALKAVQAAKATLKY